jgi:hypothetical protein
MGPYSGLGSLLFDMNNRFDVYLHDTPSKELFRRDDRRISHGCIRVEDPRKLAALVMQLPLEDIDQRIATGVTVRTPCPSRCRFSWCIRPLLRTATASCNSVRISMVATPKSGTPLRRRGKWWRRAESDV